MNSGSDCLHRTQYKWIEHVFIEETSLRHENYGHTQKKSALTNDEIIYFTKGFDTNNYFWKASSFYTPKLNCLGKFILHYYAGSNNNNGHWEKIYSTIFVNRVVGQLHFFLLVFQTKPFITR